MKSKAILISLILITLTMKGFSQDSKRTGISGTLQSNQFGVMLPIWLDEHWLLAPAMDFAYAGNKTQKGLELGIALAPRYYFRKATVSPYVGLRAGAIITWMKQDNVYDSTEENTVDLLAGAAFGGEYFISEYFSLGIEVQGNATKSDNKSSSFGNPGGINFNTATMVMATVYF